MFKHTLYIKVSLPGYHVVGTVIRVQKLRQRGGGKERDYRELKHTYRDTVIILLKKDHRF